MHEVPVRRHHGDFVEEHGRLLEQRHVPIRGAQQRDPRPPQPLRNGFRALQRRFIKLGFQELDRLLELGSVR